jgi:hypothetical protein
MLLLLHGVAGGWDELAIAVAALAVLWVAVKLAGRKSGNGEDDEDVKDDQGDLEAEPDTPAEPAPPSPTPRHS